MEELVIIGAGASGLMAAIAFARMVNAHVTILERQDRVGRKLIATGNGRCNLTNVEHSINRFHGDINSAWGVLQRFPPQSVITFFESLGVMCRNEDGRVYPYSNQASSVLDVLRMECEHLGVHEHTGFDVKELTHTNNVFEMISATGEKIYSHQVIVSTGGMAAPKLGGTDSGYKLLCALGHTLVSPCPVLVQIKTDVSPIRALTGIKFTGSARVYRGNEMLREEIGEVLFTDYGLSGPPILQLSTAVGQELHENPHANITISLDFLCDIEKDELITLLYTRISTQGYKPLEQFFTGMLNKRIGLAVLKAAGIAPLSRPSSTLNENEVEALCRAIKQFTLTVHGNQSFALAQATAGGIPLNEFDASLRSLQQENLYASGEVLNVHGDCGGFNLQWAWVSGIATGEAAAKTYLRQQ